MDYTKPFSKMSDEEIEQEVEPEEAEFIVPIPVAAEAGAQQRQADDQQRDTSDAPANFSDQVRDEAGQFNTERTEIMRVMDEVYELMQCQ